MVSIRIDLIKNRLYLNLAWVQRNRIRTLLPDIEKAVSRLEPGFACVTRIIDDREPNTADMAEIRKIQQYLLAAGMSCVVRVGTERGKNLLHLLGRDFQSIALDAATMEEAERLLEDRRTQPTRQPGNPPLRAAK